MDKKTLIKKLNKKKKQALTDCEEYHGDMLKDEGDWNKKEDDLKHYLYNCNLKEWEDVGFFVGYLRALDYVLDLLNK